MNDDVRTKQRADWSAAAAGWVEDREAASETTSPVTLALLAAAGIGAGDAVLDMACGSGDPTFAIARVVGPGGRVVGLDLVPAMIDAARSLAHGAGSSNVEFRAIDDERFPGVEAGAFDAVVCRFGLMFMPEPAGAAASWRTALRPWGRIAVSTWASFPLIPFVLNIVGEHTKLPALDPAAPGVLALASPERLADVLLGAGYAAVTVDTVRTPVFAEDVPEVWWDTMARSAGPLVTLLASLPEPTRRAVREHGIRALHERHPSGVVAEFGDALIGAGVSFRV